MQLDLLTQHQQYHLQVSEASAKNAEPVCKPSHVRGHKPPECFSAVLPHIVGKLGEEAIFENLSATHLMSFPIPSCSHSCHPQPGREEGGALESALEPPRSFPPAQVLGAALAAIWVMVFKDVTAAQHFFPVTESSSHGASEGF